MPLGVKRSAQSGRIGKDLAWIDGRDGNEELYVKRSIDGGTTWGPDTRLTTNGANSWAPSVAIVGDTAS
jgi:hypothetical protein